MNLKGLLAAMQEEHPTAASIVGDVLPSEVQIVDYIPTSNLTTEESNGREIETFTHQLLLLTDNALLLVRAEVVGRKHKKDDQTQVLAHDSKTVGCLTIPLSEVTSTLLASETGPYEGHGPGEPALDLRFLVTFRGDEEELLIPMEEEIGGNRVPGSRDTETRRFAENMWRVWPVGYRRATGP